jgi:hypothetical protein
LSLELTLQELLKAAGTKTKKLSRVSKLQFINLKDLGEGSMVIVVVTTIQVVTVA